MSRDKGGEVAFLIPRKDIRQVLVNDKERRSTINRSIEPKMLNDVWTTEWWQWEANWPGSPLKSSLLCGVVGTPPCSRIYKLVSAKFDRLISFTECSLLLFKM